MNLIKKLALAGCLTCAAFTSIAQKKYDVQSPDKKLKVQVTIADSIYYEVWKDGKAIISRSAIYFKTDQNTEGWKVNKVNQASNSGMLRPVIWQKSSTVEDNYNNLNLVFANQLSMEWRVFNNGLAWRWVSKINKPYHVTDEQATLNLGADAKAWYPQEEQFFSHNERKYIPYKVGEIDQQKLASLPALFESKGIKVLLTEASLFNYAGMWLRGDGNGTIRSTFPHYPKEKRYEGDRDEKVVSRENYIAKVNGAQDFPWRILMVEKEDKKLLNNQLPYLLGKPQATGSDFSWVKPGKVQWDWWHYNNVYDVPFRAGINNDTYKYYIDFAANNGIEYVLLDEGWCDTQDLNKQAKDIDVEELAKYAQRKNVDILLWTSWLVLDKQLDEALPRFEKWGIKGIKVDFMQRDDQDMVNYYEKVAKAAAKHHLMVDFHGAYKPTGWSRTYPNIMTSEGVLGNEISKFANTVTPEHTLTIPFIRMAAGPMDFTPGGMLNVQKGSFSAQPAEPMTLGTRCNQMAMYVMYESPLQMLCDIPTHYIKEPECMQFLKAVPTVWQRTVPLEGKVSEYAVIARQAKNGNWFIGGMTNWTARDMEVSLGFLPNGEYTMHVWKDGPNADRNAKDFQMQTIGVNKNSKINLKMSTGGGYVAIISKK
ncbi:glycoside hydrolase family 97 protein [Mucilaginibacter sp. RS28]|uniref:Glycoside hydrolase family 97 protein n=1 Tax=Mucilaginibacter straminoryzae TaxID=2932774 RepID=A0A9X1X1Y3_9SPHI|nr:glycoside hydrolase family 97 protein [Mucilaginibacter straminoryzae]MCJ8209742.1 glycoside hydrolase family 97 protein [Mucilaginibacter straminoryzae]